MLSRLLTHRLLRIAFLSVLMLAALPLASTSAATDATRTEVSFTSTHTELMDAGEEWVDEAGIYHVRGETQHDEVSGDISGTAIVVINVDFLAAGDCAEEPCPGLTEVWGEVKIEDENGWWTGRFTQSFSDIPDEEYAFTSIALSGRGGNAGMTFIGEFTSIEESSVTIEGVLSTLGAPTNGMNTNVTVCFGEEASTGSYLSSGAIEGDGAAEAIFVPSSLIWTHTYNLFGGLQLSDENGAVAIEFVSGAQDIGTGGSIGFGNYVITGGTGAYAEMYGHGRVIAALQELPGCESGFGIRIDLYGVAQYN